MASKNFFEKIKKKSFFCQKHWQGFFLVLLFFLIFTQTAWAQAFNVQKAAADLLYKIAQISGMLLGMAMWFLNLTTSSEFYDKVLFGTDAREAINLGWVVVRDFLNLFFILILLLIAIGTILRVPAYSDRKMVFNVVLAALLINFSKPIALVFIDVSQLAMGFFMSALDFEGGGNISNLILHKIKIQYALDSKDYTDSSEDYLGAMITSVSATIFFLIMAVMMFLLAATLLVRVVAYWVLIILSPMAMFGLAMPRTGLGKMNSSWMQKMFYWSFFGPIQMFFLWLATLILAKIISFEQVDKAGLLDNLPTTVYEGKELFIKAFSLILPYVSAIYLLFYGYDASKEFSTGTAKSILNWGSQKMSHYGKKIGKWGAIGGAAGIGAMAGGALGVAGAAAAAGVGAGAYYGGRSLYRNKKEDIKNRVGGWAQGHREKNSDKYPFLQTEEQKKKKRAEQREEQIARIKGGDDEKKYWRGRANKQKKDWEDLGVDDKLLQDKMKSGDEGEKKAAALLLAERGKIGKAADFDNVIEATKGDKVLEGKIRKSLKEEHVHPMLESDRERIWKNLGAFTASEDATFEAVKNNDLMKKMAKRAGIVDLTDKKKLHTHFEKLAVGKANDFEKEAYFSQLDSMSVPEMFKQKEFFNDVVAKSQMEEYLKDNTMTPGGPVKGRGFVKGKLVKEVGKMSDAKTQIEATNMINSIP